MSPRLPDFVDERFLQHRLRATSSAGIGAAVLALLLCAFRFFHDHRIDLDLLAVSLVFLLGKYSLLLWYRRTG